MLFRCAALPAVCAAGLFAQPVAIENRFGGVSVEIVKGRQLFVGRSGKTGEGAGEDIRIEQGAETVRIAARPESGEAVDLRVMVPFGVPISIATQDGDIEVSGMVRKLAVRTESGALTIAAPWEITRLDLDARRKPRRFETPPEAKFMQSRIWIGPNESIWRLRDRLDVRAAAYGDIAVNLRHSPALILKAYRPPRDWPLKHPAQSREIAARLIAQRKQRERGKPAAAPALPAEAEPPSLSGEALFVSNVRMVSLTAAVSDRQGRPVTDLDPRDFMVEEDGEPQNVTAASKDSAPFNMAILLDLSGSTSIDRVHMRNVAVKLIELADKDDRIALYALAGGMFHVLAALTADRRSLIERVQRLSPAAGGSPLWDSIALAYGEELVGREGERNALIVISDGIDNRISNQETPSTLNAARLIDAAREMDARIYPIFLRSGERFARGWSAKARSRMDKLAEVTGGRVFPALSIADVEPVLPQLAEELRSVYSIAYYPDNQNFDGGWRSVKLRAPRKDVVIRARPGYFAR